MRKLNLDQVKSAPALESQARQVNPDTADNTTSNEPAQSPPPDELEPGDFPLDALPEAARDMAAEVSRVFNVPPELPGMAALATLGVACGKAYTLTGAVNGCQNFANLYVLAGAPRGTGKSCIAEIVRPLLDVSAEMEAEHRAKILPGLKAEQAIAKKQIEAALRSVATDVPQPGERLDAERAIARLQQKHDDAENKLAASPSLWAANVTSEKLGSLLSVSRETGFIYSPEGGEVLRVFAGKYSKDGKGEFDLLLSGYTGESVRVDRQGRGPVNLANPCLSLLLAVQPPILRDLFANPEAVQRGLITRTLAFVCEVEPREDDGRIDEINPDVRARWHALVRRILAVRHKYADAPRNVSCSQSAREGLRDFYNEAVRLRRGKFADVQGELSRWRENACRASLALAVGDSPDADTLTANQAARAVQLVRWAQLSTLALLTAGQQAARLALAKRVREILKEAGGQMTLRDLLTHHGIEHGQARSLAAWQPQTFTVERKQGERGRPSEVLRLV